MKKLIYSILSLCVITSSTSTLVACHADPSDNETHYDHEYYVHEFNYLWTTKMKKVYTTQVDSRAMNHVWDTFDYQSYFNDNQAELLEYFLNEANSYNSDNFKIDFSIELKMNNEQDTKNYLVLKDVVIDGISFDDIEVPWLLVDYEYSQNDKDAVNAAVTNFNNLVDPIEAVIPYDETTGFFSDKKNINNFTNEKIIATVKDSNEMQNIIKELNNSFDDGNGKGASNADLKISDLVCNDIVPVDAEKSDWEINLNAMLSGNEIFNETVHRMVSYKIATQFKINGTNNIGLLKAIWIANHEDQDPQFDSNNSDLANEIRERADFLKKDSTKNEDERKEVLKDFVNYCYQLDITVDEIVWDNETGIWDLTNLAKYLPPFVDADGNAIIQVNFWENES